VIRRFVSLLIKIEKFHSPFDGLSLLDGGSLLWEFESSEKPRGVAPNSVGPCESLTVEKPKIDFCNKCICT